MKKIAIGYVRVSTDKQELGPEAQRQAIEAWAAREGFEVASWHQDEDVGGAIDIEKRPGLMAALAALGTHGATAQVAAKRDRIARDVVLAAMVERLAERVGARVVSAAGEGTASDSPADELFRRIIDAFAAYERQIIAARTKAAAAVKKGRGEQWGCVPIGHEQYPTGRTNRKGAEVMGVRPRPGWVEAREAAKAMRAQGAKPAAIAAMLTARGFTPGGGVWARSAVQRVMDQV